MMRNEFRDSDLANALIDLCRILSGDESLPHVVVGEKFSMEEIHKAVDAVKEKRKAEDN